MAQAAEFFRENLQLFGNLEEKEKYNMYGGLIALAKDIKNIEAKLDNVSWEISNLANKLH